MSIVTLRLPDVKRKTEMRPLKCPHCRGETFQRWGSVRKPVRDNRLRSVRPYRYCCCHCLRTFRHYPQGVDQADQTERLRKFAALLWVMGLSLRGTVMALSAIGVTLSHMTVWRDIQEQADLLSKRRHWQNVRVLGLDGVYPLMAGKKRPVLIAVDLGNGQPLVIGYVNEFNPQAVRRFLEPLVKRLGVSVIVTDDLVHYKRVAEKLELEHQICQFHVRRWVGLAVHALKETVPKDWLWVLDEIKALLADLPPDGGLRLYER
jgi:transposase-like protein